MNPNKATVKIAGQNIDLYLGIGYWSALMKYYGKPLQDTLEHVKTGMTDDPFTVIPEMLSIAANCQAKKDKRDDVMTPDDVIDLIDQDGGLTSTAISQFVEVWTASMQQDVPEPEKKGKGSRRKKRPTTTSTLQGT